MNLQDEVKELTAVELMIQMQDLNRRPDGTGLDRIRYDGSELQMAQEAFDVLTGEVIRRRAIGKYRF